MNGIIMSCLMRGTPSICSSIALGKQDWFYTPAVKNLDFFRFWVDSNRIWLIFNENRLEMGWNWWQRNWWQLDIWIFGYLDIWILVKTVAWCIPNPDFCVVQPCRGLFFLRKTLVLWKNMLFDCFSMIFHQNGPNLLLNRETTIRTGILTLIEFWWVP